MNGPALIAIAVLIYLVLPGHSELPLHGVPLGPTGTLLASFAAMCAIAGRPVSLARGVTVAALAVIAALAAVRTTAASATVPSGWRAQYFANDEWRGAPQWSSDFRWTSATRLDPAIAFAGDRFPVHYLNGHTFARGTRREVTEPLSIRWSAETVLAIPTTVELDARFKGGLTLTVDEVSIVSVPATGAGALERVTQQRVLPPGRHLITVGYVKPAGIDGLVAFDARIAESGTALPMYPSEARGSTSPLLRQAALIADGAIVAVLAGLSIFIALRRWQVAGARKTIVVAAIAASLFGIQGWLAAVPLEGRYTPLDAGDDWFGFESRARDVLQHGPLMTLDAPLGEGAPYFYHPFYSYFLAAVHALTGESLAGPILVHFLLLGVVSVIMWTVTRRWFGEWPAAFGIAALIGLFELDFARYYTVTLLSENLYVLTVTCTLVSFMRWIEGERTSDLILAGVWAGIASITRPAMMMYFLPALVVIVVVALRRARRPAAALRSSVLLASLWLAVIAPVTLRNWVVSGRAVLISEGVGSGVVRYNLPEGVDAAPYLTGFSGSVTAGLSTLVRIAWDHPWQMLKLQAGKLGFSLGMVHWRNGYRPHPELVGAMVLYLAMCWLSPILRSAVFWPVHAFVIAHVASMGLTDPANYGYRLILPPFIYTTTFGVAALVERGLRRQAVPVGDPAGLAA